MNCPTLRDLPPPPPGRSGWPWTEEISPLSSYMADGQPWPRLSVVTPSYQQAEFLEATIRSVLLQGYPNLEYIVIDGGSRDGSIEIIQKYAPWLDYWVSERDRGQSHAINKGFARATGDIVAWINSDDFYLPASLGRLAPTLITHPRCAAVYTDGVLVDVDGVDLVVLKSAPMDLRSLVTGTNYGIPQPTVLMRKAAVDEVGGIDESLHMAMDLDLWLKLALGYELRYVDGPSAAALRVHASQKTQTRVYEDCLASLQVLSRALDDPRCPPDLGVRNNPSFARIYMDLAEIELLEHHNPRRSLAHFAQSLAACPQLALHRAGVRLAVRLYRATIPRNVQQQVRRWRGTDGPRMVEAG